MVLFIFQSDVEVGHVNMSNIKVLSVLSYPGDADTEPRTTSDPKLTMLHDHENTKDNK